MIIVGPLGAAVERIVAARELNVYTTVVTTVWESSGFPERASRTPNALFLVKDFAWPTLAAAAAAVHDRRRVDGVIAGGEFQVEAASCLAEALRLPGLSRQAATIVRSKTRTRQTLREAGIPVQSFAEATDREHVVATDIGYVTAPHLVGSSYRRLDGSASRRGGGLAGGCGHGQVRGGDAGDRCGEIGEAVAGQAAGVSETGITIRPGQPIPPGHDVQSTLAYVLFTAPNRPTADRLIRAITTLPVHASTHQSGIPNAVENP